MIESVPPPADPAAPFVYRRRRTRVVRVGDVGIGGDEPIRVQSMTTPATTDIEATVAQAVRLVEAGCEIVRITVPSKADAEALPAIRAGLARRGVRVPLVADIHFSPQAALLSVPHVEKVRVNPGNFADKKRFAQREYTDAEYAAELARLEERFAPLVRACRNRGVALRIGTNHGSLSDRILNRHGDTPLGMVESALEFVRICRRLEFHELVLSMKSSNPMVAIQAYRLLAERMAAEDMDYPFHLGVTEAGDGEDGRVKSAIGIGALLEDGLGDTVRVSLTEDPVAEIPVALALVRPFNERAAAARSGTAAPEIAPRRPPPDTRDPLTYRRRSAALFPTGPVAAGAEQPVRCETLIPAPPDSDAAARALLDALAGPGVPPETRTEVLEVVLADPAQTPAFEALAALVAVRTPLLGLAARVTAAFLQAETRDHLSRVLRAAQRLTLRVQAPLTEDGLLKRGVGLDLARAAGLPLCWILTPADGVGPVPAETAADLAVDLVERTRRAGLESVAVGLEPGFAGAHAHAFRLLAARLDAARLAVPLVLVDIPARRGADPILGPAQTLGGLLCDGLGDALRIETRDPAGRRATDPAVLARDRELAFTVLQGSRLRIVRTEFISCPSCGRTMFDLEETTRRIKARTAHLKGLKIAIMGCVVNGPGEMADADFGYVGWGPGLIALFVGHRMVARDIPMEAADERLVTLIREHGRWVDPPA